MDFKAYIGKVVISTKSKKKFILTKVTAPKICVRTVEVGSSGYHSHYVWDTINGDPFSNNDLVFEDASLNEPFKKAYKAYSKTEDAYWENYAYWMRKD